MKIDAELDGGAIEIVRAEDPGAIELALRPDTAAGFMQWFHFRLSGAKNRACRLRIVNAGQATYADAWKGYRVAASHDGQRWVRLSTKFDGDVLDFTLVPRSDDVRLAYFAPYSWERHEALLERANRSNLVRLETLGRTVQGRPLDMVVVGDERPERHKIWIQARQHPGETMAEWFAEGAIERLIDEADELASALLSRATFYIVPSVNPDGGVLGNLRTNAAGTDLNRAWLRPTAEASPEVLAVRDRMGDTGVDLFLDVHGDERNPYVFAAGCEGNPSYSERLDALEDLFMQSLVELDPDFQREYGYDRDAPGEGDLSTAANYVGERFDCLSLTLEMPFKDNANHPDPARGWTPERAKGFGRTALESTFVCLDSLR